MLETLRKGTGFRIAMTLAIFAALCLVAPPGVMAFGHGGNTLHCLSQVDVPNHGVGHHAGHATQKARGEHAHLPPGKVPGCCGLFCLSALLPSCTPALAVLELDAAFVPQPEAHFFGRVPTLPDRPPISTLSV